MLGKAGLVVTALSAAAVALPAVASADATDDYPIPNRMLRTTCTAEQIMAAARDTDPVYFERYMIDYHNHSPDVQSATQDKMHWFYSMDYAGRRQFSEDMVTSLGDPLTGAWPNHAKLFFNNKGVAAHTTDVCSSYPTDPAIWDYPAHW
ncbi:DUF5078 domain-containing protein [Mycobacterium sp. 1274761.0]|uniref:DUF5078 domain-containing protein n=1 Tax=Mycobacterium sp. 1274761.0 TaxID=1834077 RepID=UPI000800EF01|nr:DUF5078 domain-containing protein [Mycobacterium sp. 1274761.0]OBK78798.1 hypothetical protein A5651_02460 [Mycobacterium sp. 1274761.0]